MNQFTHTTQRKIYLLVFLLSLESACLPKWYYEKAHKEDTIEVYEAYLKSHKNDKYSETARARLEELYFEKALKENTYAAYTAFVERYPFDNLSQEAERRAEDIRAKELGIHLYRSLPEDYYSTVTATELPFRIMVKAKGEEGRRRESEIRWFEELKRRDAFVPMDPRKIHRTKPDIVLYLRESSVTFYSFSWALVEAEVWAGGKLVRSYKIASTSTEHYLLYEMLKDHELISSYFHIPKREVESVDRSFRKALFRLPLRGSLSIEYELHSSGSEWDRTLIQEFLAFVEDHHLCKELFVYQRGHPPSRMFAQKAFIRVDPETHAPVFSLGVRFGDELTDWTAWNSKRVLLSKDFFFKKMLLDIIDTLVSQGALSYRSRG